MNAEIWVHREPSRSNAGLHVRPLDEAARGRLVEAVRLSPGERRGFECTSRAEMRADRRLRVLSRLFLFGVPSGGIALSERDGAGRITMDPASCETVADALAGVFDHDERLLPAVMDGRESRLWIWWPLG